MSGAVNNLISDVEGGIDSLWNAAQNLANQIQNAFNSGLSWISGELNDLGSELATTVSDVAQFIGNTLEQAATGLEDLVVGYVNTLQQAYDAAENAFKQLDPTLYADINNGLKSIGDATTDFLKKYGHAIVDVVANYFCPGSSILIDLLWAEAENGWKPVSLTALGTAAAEGLANEALPGVDAAVSDVLPDALGSFATGALNNAVNTYIANDGNVTPGQLLQGAVTSGLLSSGLNTLPDITSALENVIPGLQSGVEFVQTAEDDVTNSLGLVEETASAIEQLTQQEIVALGTKELNQLGQEVGIGAIVSTDASVNLNVDQVLGLVADQLFVEVPVGDIVALTDTAQQITSLTSAQLDAIARTGVDVLKISDDLGFDLNLSQLSTFEQVGLSIEDGAQVTLSDTASAIDSYIAGLGVSQIDALKQTGIDEIQADAPVALDVLQATTAAANDLLINVPGNALSVLDTASDIAGMTVSEIEGLKTLGVQTINAEGALALDEAQATALEQAGAVIDEVGGGVAALSDTAQEIAAMTVQQMSALVGAGIKEIEADSSMVLDAVQALSLASEGVRLSVNVGDIAELSDAFGTIEDLTSQQIQSLAADGISELNLSVTQTLQEVELGQAAPGLALSVSQFAAAEADGINLVVPAANVITVVDDAANVVKDGVALKTSTFEVSVVDNINDTLANLSALASDQISSLKLWVDDNVSDLSNNIATATADLKSAGLFAQTAFAATDTVADYSQAIANGSIGRLISDGVTNWIVEDTDSQLNASLSEIQSLVSDGVSQIDLEATSGITSLNISAIEAIWSAASDASVVLKSTEKAANQLIGTASNIEQLLTQFSFQKLVQSGVTQIVAQTGTLGLGADELDDIIDANINVVAGIVGSKIPGVVQLSDTSSAIENLFASLGTSAAEKLKAAGVSQLVSIGGTVILNAENQIALAEAGIAASGSVLQDIAANIQSLTAAQLGSLQANGVATISVSGSLTLSIAQVEAIGNVIVDVPAQNQLTIADAANTILGLTSSRLAKLSSIGIDKIQSEYSSIVLSLSQVMTFAAAGFTITAAGSNQVILQDTKALVEGFTTSQIAEAGAAGVTQIVSADGSPISLNVGQVLALEDAGVGLSNGVLFDTAANISALTPAELAALSGAGITSIASSDQTATATGTVAAEVVLNVAQVEALEQASVKVSTGVILNDTGQDIAAMSIAQLQELKSVGITNPLQATGSVSLTAAQVGALTGEGLAVSTEYDAQSVEALSPEQIAALAAEGVGAITVFGTFTPATLSFSAAQLNAFVAAGIQIVDTNQDPIPLTLCDTLANIEQLTPSQITAFEQYGVQSETIADTAATFINAPASAIQSLEVQALTPAAVSSIVTVTEQQEAPQVVALTNGDFAINYGVGDDVFAPDGDFMGGTVHSSGEGSEESDASAANGVLVVTYPVLTTAFPADYQSGIAMWRTQNYSTGTGPALGLQLYPNTNYIYGGPSTVALTNGYTAVAWSALVNGTRVQGDPFLVGPETAYVQTVNTADASVMAPTLLGPVYGTPVLAALPSGAFVVAWDEGQYSGGSGYNGDPYTDFGPLALEFVNSSQQVIKPQPIPYVYSDPSIAANANGQVLVAFDGSLGVTGVIYNSSGVAQTLEFSIGTWDHNDDTAPAVAALQNGTGDFIVVWESGYGLEGIILNQNGVALGNAFIVDTPAISPNQAVIPQAQDVSPSVAAISADEVVVSWEVNYLGGQVPVTSSVVYREFAVPPDPSFSVSDTIADILGTPSGAAKSALSADDPDSTQGPLTVVDTAANISGLTTGANGTTDEIQQLITKNVQTLVADGNVTFTVSQVEAFGSSITVEVPFGDTVSLQDTAADIENYLAVSGFSAPQELGVTSFAPTDHGLILSWTEASTFLTNDYNVTLPSGLDDAYSNSSLVNQTTGELSLTPGQIAQLKQAGFSGIDLGGSNTGVLISAADAAALVSSQIGLRVSNLVINPNGPPVPLRFSPVTLSDSATDIEQLSPEQIEELGNVGISAVIVTGYSSLSLSVSQALAFASANIPITVALGQIVSVSDTSKNIQALTAPDIASLSGRISSITVTDGLDPTFNVGQILALEVPEDNYEFSGIYLNEPVILSDTTARILALTLPQLVDAPTIARIELTDKVSAQPLVMTVGEYQNFAAYGYKLFDASGAAELPVTISDTASAIESLTPGQISTMLGVASTQPVVGIEATDAPLVFNVAQFGALIDGFGSSNSALPISAPGGVTAEDSAANLLTPVDPATNAAVNISPYARQIAGVVLVDTIAHLEALSPTQVTQLSNTGVTSWMVADTIADLSNLVSQGAVASTLKTLTAVLPWQPQQAIWSVVDTAADVDTLTIGEVGSLASLGVTTIISTGGSVTISAAVEAALQSNNITIDLSGGGTLNISDSSMTDVKQLVSARIVAASHGEILPALSSANQLTDISLSSQIAADTSPGLSLPGGQSVNAQGDLTFGVGTGNAISIVAGSSNTLSIELKTGAGALSVTAAGAANVQGNGGADVLISGTVADINATLATLSFNDPTLDDTQLAVSVTDGQTSADGVVNISGGDLGPSESLPGGQLVTSGALAFSVANNNNILVSGNGNLTSTLTVSDGTLTIGTTSGVVIVGNQTAVVSLTGSASAINNALATLVYQPGAAFAGDDALRLTTSDRILSTNGQIELVGTGGYPGPSVTMPGGQSVGAGNSLAFDAGNGNLITVGGAAGTTLSVTVTVSHGTLAAQASGSASEQISGNGQTLAISGSVADINATLRTLTYSADSNYVGNDNISVVATEGSSTAAAQTVLVDGLDRAPANLVPSSQMVGASGLLTFSSHAGNGISVVDPNGGNVVVELSSSHGTLSVTGQPPAAPGSTLTISGSLADVNASLQTLSYQLLDANYVGSDAIVMSTQDSQFNILSTILVSTAATYRAPSLDLAEGIIVPPGGTVTLSGSNAIVVSAPATSSLTTTISIAEADATLSAVAAGSATVQSSYVGGESILTIKGSAQDTNATLQTLAVQAAANFDGGASLNVVTTDGTTDVTGSQTITSNGGGEITFTVGADLTSQLSAGSLVTVGGTTASGGSGAGFNGQFTVVSVSSSSVVVAAPGFTYPGAYQSGGTLAGAAISAAFWTGNGDLAQAPGEVMPASQQLGSGTLAFNSQNDNAITVSDPEGYLLTTSLSVNNGTLAATATNGAIITGETLTLQLSEAVNIDFTGAAPTLSLSNGATATYAGGSGSNALTFSYTPTGSGVPTVVGVNPNSADITDLSGNPVSNLMTLQTGLLTTGLTIAGPASSIDSTLATLTYQSAAGPGTGDVLTATAQPTIAVTSANWSSDGGGLITFGVATNLANELLAGSVVDFSGVTASGGISEDFNGQYVVVAVTSDSIEVARSPGIYEKGGSILPVSGFDGNGDPLVGVSIASVTGAAWPTATSSQMTFTVGTDLTSQSSSLINQLIEIAGVQSTGVSNLGFNGLFTIDAVTSSTITVTPYAPGSYAGGGSIELGGVDSSVTDQTVLMASAVTGVVSVPGGQSLNGQGAATFGTAEHNAITISGSGNAQITVYVYVANGNLGLPGTLQAGVIAQTIPSDGVDSKIKLTGTASAITQALNGLNYQSVAGYSGTDELGIVVTTGSGAVAAVNMIGLTPSAVDLAPAIVVPGGQKIGQGGSLSFGTATSNPVTIRSSASKLSAKLSISHGTLSATAAGSATIEGVLTISFAAPVTITGGNSTSTNPGVPTLALSGGGTAIYAGGSGSNVLTFSYSAVAGENTADLSIAGVTLNGATVTDSKGNPVSLVQPVAVVGSSLEIDGSSTDVNATLQSLKYQENANYVGGDILNLAVSDGTYSSSNQIVLAAASPDAGPGCSVPGGQSIPLSGELAFGSATGNAIVVHEANASNLSVQLSASNGSLAVQAQGAAVVSHNNGILDVSGSVADVNATLNTLTYTENAGYYGSDQLDVLVSDGLVSTSASIDLQSLDLGPSLSLPGGQLVGSGGTVSLGSASNNAITVTAPNGSNPTTTILVTTVRVGEGTLSATAQGSATVSAGGSSLTITGSVVDTNATLNTLSYAEGSSFNGSDTLYVSTTDGYKTSLASITLAAASLTASSSDSLVTTKAATTALTVSGTASATGEVTVQLFDANGNAIAGQSYTTSASAGGGWSVQLNLQSLPDENYSIASTLTVSGVISAPVIQPLMLHVTPPSITMNVLDGGSVDGAEAVAGMTLSGTLTGIAAGGVAQVTIVVSDGSFLKSYTGTVSQDAASWSLAIPYGDTEMLPNGTAQISAQVTDQFGNLSNTVSQAVQIHEVIVKNGQTYTLTSGQTDVGDVASNGGTIIVANGGKAQGAVIENGGTISVQKGGTETNTAISGGEGVVNSGATSVESTIVNDGRETIDAGGIAESPTIQGGTLELASGAEVIGDIQFQGSYGTLQIDGIIPSTVVSGFGAGNVIDLVSAAYDPAGTVTLAPKNVLQVVENGTTYNLQLDPDDNLVGDNFVLGNAGSQGTTISILPQLSVRSVPSAMPGQTLALSNLVTISDMGHVGFQLLELWDSKGTVAGGQFVVDGVAQTGGHEIDVTPANVANTVFDVGTVVGTDPLWARLLENDGATTAWQELTVSVPEPILSVMNDTTVAAGNVVSLSNLVTISDPAEVGYQRLELWDSAGTATGGQFAVNGVAQTGGHAINVTPANVANTVFDVGTSGGTDTLWALLVENDNTETSWEEFTVGAQQPTTVVHDDPGATTGQAINLSNLVTIADPSKLGYKQLELWDSNGTASTGRFVVNGVAQTGGHEIDVNPANVANTMFDVGTSSVTDTLWARLELNNGSTTAWQSFTVAVPEVVLSVVSDNNAAPGQQLALSTLVSVNDAGNVGYKQLELWDGNGTVAGGQFIVNGVAQTGNHEIDVSPANVANTIFEVGTGGGTDILWARVEQNDGTLSGWQQFGVTVQKPTLSVQSLSSATAGQVISLSNLITITDPNSLGYQKLELWDNDGTAAGGQLVINGIAQTGGHEIDVASAGVANTLFDMGTSSGTDTLWARLQQQDGSTSTWQAFSITVPEPTLAANSVASMRSGQAVSLASLVTVSDPGNVGYQTLQLWDSDGTVAGGEFLMNGAAQTAAHAINVPAGANVVFDAGTSGGTDTLWAQLIQSNGTASGWDKFTITVPNPTVAVQNFTTATPGQTIALSDLVTISDPGNVGYQKLELWDSDGSAATGQFMVGGVGQTGGHEIDVSPANVASAVFDEGTTGNTDTLWAQLQLNNGTTTGWEKFTVVDPVEIAQGATLELTGPYAGQAIFAGNAGTLQLDDSADFSGTVAGMSGSDTIDFKDVGFGANTTLGYTADATKTGGSLSVGDGIHQARIALLGQYSANSFVTASDAQGGTTIQLEPSQPAVIANSHAA